MKENYRRWFLWSSFGSLAVGAVVAMARRARRMERQPLCYRRLPRECQGIVLWTEAFEVEDCGARPFVHDQYILRPTSFKLWSILDLPSAELSGSSRAEGFAIFHVTRTRITDGADEDAIQATPRQPERFYGVIAVVDPSTGVATGSAIARGGILEIKKCYVGGASNGVESGEIHRSATPVLNYRILYESS